MCPCAAWRTFCNLPACPNVTVCNMLCCVLVGLTIGARGDPNIKLPPQCHSQPTFLSDPNSHIVPRTIGAQLPFGQTQCPFERVFAFADKSARARPHHMELSPSNNTLTDPSGIAYTIAYELFWCGWGPKSNIVATQMLARNAMPTGIDPLVARGHQLNVECSMAKE